MSTLNSGPDPRSHYLDAPPALPTVPYFEPLAGPVPRTDMFRRAVDLVVSACGLVVLSPLLLTLAVAVRLQSPGPVILRQLRLGRHGRPFLLHKFRSIRVSDGRTLSPFEGLDDRPAGVLFKIARNPSVTKIGDFLRRTRLDDLPQLWSVFTGDMTLVGPRPLHPGSLDRFSATNAAALYRCLEFPPGLTGLPQTEGRDLSPIDRLYQDYAYFEDRSFLGDLIILFRTVALAVSGIFPVPRGETAPRPAVARETRRPVSGAITFGAATYPLRQRFEGVSSREQGGPYTFRADAVLPQVVGRGSTADEAYRDWCKSVHVTFQRLFRTLPMDQSAEDRRCWGALADWIDVERYGAARPIVAREVGKVASAGPGDWSVEWLEGVEAVGLEAMPEEFAGLRKGDWFEAIVEREAATGRFLKARHVQPTGPVAPIAPDQLDDWWAGLPTTAQLPPSPRNPTRR